MSAQTRRAPHPRLVSEWDVLELPVSPRAKLVLLVVRRRLGRRGGTWTDAGDVELARECRCSERTIRRVKVELRGAGVHVDDGHRETAPGSGRFYPDARSRWNLDRDLFPTTRRHLRAVASPPGREWPGARPELAGPKAHGETPPDNGSRYGPLAGGGEPKSAPVAPAPANPDERDPPSFRKPVRVDERGQRDDVTTPSVALPEEPASATHDEPAAPAPPDVALAAARAWLAAQRTARTPGTEGGGAVRAAPGAARGQRAPATCQRCGGPVAAADRPSEADEAAFGAWCGSCAEAARKPAARRTPRRWRGVYGDADDGPAAQ